MDKTPGVAHEGGLTRADVARILGISLTTVRRKEGKTLHPKQGPKNVRIFDPVEVEAERQRMLAERQPAPAPEPAQAEKAQAVPAAERASSNGAAGAPAASPGEAAPSPLAAVAPPPAKPEDDGAIAAQVFELFSEGKSLVEAVIETQLVPALVEKLYETWQRFQAKDVTSPAACSRIDEMAAAIKKLDASMQSSQQDGVQRADEIDKLGEHMKAVEQVLISQGICRRRESPSASDEALD
jgi:hypothetical protein